MLGGGPLGHLQGAHRREQERGQGLHGQREEQPAGHLARVVGAGDVVEQEARGDFVALLSRGAQVGQDDVAPARRVGGWGA